MHKKTEYDLNNNVFQVTNSRINKLLSPVKHRERRDKSKHTTNNLATKRLKGKSSL